MSLQVVSRGGRNDEAVNLICLCFISAVLRHALRFP
jgi:hypothetical protein